MGGSRLVIFRDLLNTLSTPLKQHGIVSFYEFFHNYLKVNILIHSKVDPACEGGRREGGRRFIVTGGKVALRSLAHYQSAVYEAKLLTIRSADCRL